MQTGQSTETNHVIGVGGGCPGARAGRAPAAPRAEREVARDAPFRGAATSHSRNTIIYIYIYVFVLSLSLLLLLWWLLLLLLSLSLYSIGNMQLRAHTSEVHRVEPPISGGWLFRNGIVLSSLSLSLSLLLLLVVVVVISICIIRIISIVVFVMY